MYIDLSICNTLKSFTFSKLSMTTLLKVYFLYIHTTNFQLKNYFSFSFFSFSMQLQFFLEVLDFKLKSRQNNVNYTKRTNELYVPTLL